MSATRLQEYLETNHVAYSVVPHTPAFTARESAVRSHLRPAQLAKTVIVKLDGKLAMAVVPADAHVSFTALRDQSGCQQATLASESDFRDAFPDCELGAMPPFGNLYNMRVFVDESLARESEIAFNACSHQAVVRMAYTDFARLVRPAVLPLARHSERKAARGPVPLW